MRSAAALRRVVWWVGGWLVFGGLVITVLATAASAEGAWVERQLLTASDDDGAPGSGFYVAIDGDVVVAGAGAGDGNEENSGAAYVFRRQVNGTWAEEAKLIASDGGESDGFGRAIGVSGGVIAVGAPGHGAGGAVYLFEQDGATGVWRETAKLTPSRPTAAGGFGLPLAIDHDTLAIGGQDPTGWVYVFRQEPATEAWVEDGFLTGSDPEDSDGFGWSVDVEGDRIVAGASGRRPDGAVFVFDRTGTGLWQENAVLNGTGAFSGFGVSVAVSGDRLLVGAPGDGSGGFLYARRVDGTWEEAAHLVIEDPVGTGFGNFVDLDGAIALVGGPGLDRDVVSVFVREGPGVWPERGTLVPRSAQEFPFIWSGALSGETVVLGGSNDFRLELGQAHVFVPAVSGSYAPVASISGTVVDRDTGEGLADMCVDARAYVGSGQEPYRASTRTDLTGAFHLEVFAPEDYELEASECHEDPRYFPSDWSAPSTRVLVESGDAVTDVELTMQLGSRMSGVVIAATGDPLDQICANAWEPYSGGGLLLHSVGITDGDGYFSFLMQPGDFGLYAVDCFDHEFENELIPQRTINRGQDVRWDTIVLEPTAVLPHDSVGFYDPSRAYWSLRNETGPALGLVYGVPGDIPIVGDWDCDGFDSIGVYRSRTGSVHLRNTNTQGPADEEYFFGVPGDIPLAGDFNGDGCDTVSVFRPSGAHVYVSNVLGTVAAEADFYFGVPGDRPFTGDFDGDGTDTVGLYRESTGLVYIGNSLATGLAEFTFFYGQSDDQVHAGDWDDNGIDTIGVYRQGDHRFFLRNSNSTGFADLEAQEGYPGVIGVTGNWNIG